MKAFLNSRLFELEEKLSKHIKRWEIDEEIWVTPHNGYPRFPSEIKHDLKIRIEEIKFILEKTEI